MIRDALDIPQIEPGMTLRKVAESFFLSAGPRTPQLEKAELRPLRKMLATGVYSMFGTRAGQIEEERIPERLIEVLGIKPRFSMLAGPGHQFLAVRLFPAGARPDSASNPSASKGKHGRPRGISFEKEDTPIVEEMHRLIESGTARSATDALKRILQDPGFRVIGTSDESKIRRVVARYKKVYPEHNGA